MEAASKQAFSTEGLLNECRSALACCPKTELDKVTCKLGFLDFLGSTDIVEAAMKIKKCRDDVGQMLAGGEAGAAEMQQMDAIIVSVTQMINTYGHASADEFLAATEPKGDQSENVTAWLAQHPLKGLCQLTRQFQVPCSLKA
jgi:hypothetical protein